MVRRALRWESDGLGDRYLLGLRDDHGLGHDDGVCLLFRQGADDSLSLRPADFERLVQVLVHDELQRPSEGQRRGRLVRLFIGEGGPENLREPAGFLLGQQVRACAYKDSDVGHRLANRNDSRDLVVVRFPGLGRKSHPAPGGRCLSV
jgi:hypothetical protein